MRSGSGLVFFRAERGKVHHEQKSKLQQLLSCGKVASQLLHDNGCMVVGVCVWLVCVVGVCVCACVRVCVCACVHVCVRIHACVCVHGTQTPIQVYTASFSVGELHQMCPCTTVVQSHFSKHLTTLLLL